MIELQDVSFSYRDGTVVFDRFSWRVQAGERWSVLGPSGCGKTTLLTLLAGLRRPTSGRLLIADAPLMRPRPRTGLILQDFGLLPWATVWENAALGLRLRRFYGPDGLHAPADGVPADLEEVVGFWLERLGIAALRDQFPGQLSGGQRQRTAIARTLALDPDLLLMDEPFASLDAPTREALQDLTLQLWTERDLTVVTVTHALEEAALLGERILVLGAPPNRKARLLENPQAASPGYRGSRAYVQRCAQLREALEAVR